MAGERRGVIRHAKTPSRLFFHPPPPHPNQDEENNWDMNVDELALRLEANRERGTNVRALAVINPGNPTGQVLTEESMRDIIRFCDQEGLVLLADEVYQSNIYTEERPFHSFKKVLMSMPEHRDSLELASFHSLSKGVLGECGRRGGYMELINFDKGVRDQILKRSSINLCSNVAAQVMVGLMCRPPQAGDESYPLYAHETEMQLGRWGGARRAPHDVCVPCFFQLFANQINSALAAFSFSFTRVAQAPRAEAVRSVQLHGGH